MKRMLPVLAVAFAVGAAGCGSSNTSPSAPSVPTFTASLLPANETPPVTGAEATGSGTMTIKLNLTKDSAGNVTSATADFRGTFSGFPAGTTLTGAHIHQAAAGVSGSIVVPIPLASGEIVFTNGSGTLNKTGVAVSPADLATQIMNNPAGFYFNIHSTLNPAGVIRGQLVRVQ